MELASTSGVSPGIQRTCSRQRHHSCCREDTYLLQLRQLLLQLLHKSIAQRVRTTHTRRLSFYYCAVRRRVHIRKFSRSERRRLHNPRSATHFEHRNNAVYRAAAPLEHRTNDGPPSACRWSPSGDTFRALKYRWTFGSTRIYHLHSRYVSCSLENKQIKPR